MDRRFLCASVHHRLISGVTEEMDVCLRRERPKAAMDHSVILIKRSVLRKVKSQNKLAMVDAGAAILRFVAFSERLFLTVCARYLPNNTN